MTRIVAAAALAVAAAGAYAGPQEDDFLAAREAFRVGDARKLDLYAKRLRGHVLEPYVAYWQLRLRLDDATPGEVRTFLANNADTLLAERLRTEWLKALARDQDWDTFQAELGAGVGEDLELTCYALQAKSRAKPTEALQEARPLWFVGRELPDNCTPLFKALAAAGQLSEEDVWSRVRLSLELGQTNMAWRVGTFLPPGTGPELRTLMLVSSNPAGYLDKPVDLKTRALRETAMFAVYRLARSSPSQAAGYWARLESRFSEDDRAYVWGQLAYFAAMRHDPAALEWYAKAGDLSDLQLAWKVRAALLVRSWKDVLAAIDAMTAKERGQSSWRYWKARALEALGRSEEALALFKPLSGEYNFYGQLALEALGEKIAVPPVAYKPSNDEVRAISGLPGIQRALALYKMNLRVDGTREWFYTIRNLDDKQLLAASEVARRNELWDRAINTADRTESLHDFSLRYVAPYRQNLKTYTTQLDLDEAWVYGLIRQESRFVASARSSAGAGGLMQLMPATAKWVATKLGLRNWHVSQVTDIDTNLSLGTYYLKHVLDTLDGSSVLASAAYNAGPGRARAWRTDAPLEGAVYAEAIPFNETRDYVKKVMSNATYYAHTFTQQLQSLRQRLGVIAPRRANGETPLGDTP
ncbi:MAG: transglycosylase SLT domain-containing protein [Rhodospirillaceae bacterium]